jgi:hypothetical protein
VRGEKDLDAGRGQTDLEGRGPVRCLGPGRARVGGKDPAVLEPDVGRRVRYPQMAAAARAAAGAEQEVVDVGQGFVLIELRYRPACHPAGPERPLLRLLTVLILNELHRLVGQSTQPLRRGGHRPALEEEGEQQAQCVGLRLGGV